MSNHRDHFGREIEVGDILLGAKAGGKYVDTVYHFAVVVTKTTKLLRVHQLNGFTSPHNITAAIVKERLKERAGRPAGKVIPQTLLKTGVNVGLTQQEMLDAIEAGIYKTSSIPSVDFLWP